MKGVLNAGIRISVICVLTCVFCRFQIGAASFPERPVHIIVGFSPGGGVDVLARLIAQGLSQKWNQPVIVENRPGGDATVAQDIVAHSKPDGYTLLMATDALINTAGKYKIDYDPIKSFAPITVAAEAPDVLLVNPSFVQAATLQEWVALAKAKTGQLNFGSSGTSSPPYHQMATLMEATGTNLVNVTYNGAAPALVALLGGEIQTMFGGVSGAAAPVKSGKLKALGITGEVHVPALPELRTFPEMAGIHGIDSAWNGVLAPVATPDELINKMHDDIAAVLHSDEILKISENQGFVIIANSPREFRTMLDAAMVRQMALLKKIGNK